MIVVGWRLSNKYMAITEIKKNNIGDQVYCQMKDQILSGEWKPGDRIPSENQLISLFGVSRGTIRQALQRLNGEGLIITRHGEGSFVQITGLDSYFQTSVPLFHIGADELEQIFEFRGMFESGVAEIAALKATDEQIARLEENYERMQRKDLPLSQFLHIDLDFHMLISECTQNTLATQIYTSYETLLEPSIYHMVQIIGRGNGLKYHGMLLDAIRNHDAKRARAVMEEHMEENMEHFRQMRSSPQNADTDQARKSGS